MLKPSREPDQSACEQDGGLSISRVLVIATPLLVLAAAWFHFSVLYRQAPDTVSNVHQAINTVPPAADAVSNIPPSAVFGLFLPVLLVAAAVPTLRRRWKLTRAELVALFSMLSLALPMFGTGLWFHLVGLQQEYHRTHKLAEAMEISPNLWPNQGNLLEETGTEDSISRGIRWTMSHPERTARVDEPDGIGHCWKIVHARDEETSTLTLQLNQAEAARFVRPKVRYAVLAYVRLDDASRSPSVALSAAVTAVAFNRLFASVTPSN